MGVNIQLALRCSYDRIQAHAEAEMAAITLQDIIDEYQAAVGGKAKDDGAALM